MDPFDAEERRLRADIERLASLRERAAPSQAAVVRALQGRLRRGRTARIVATVAAALVLTLLAVALPAALEDRGAAPPFPGTTGILVTRSPDGSGRCYAVRIYTTTADDGRVALWSWTGRDGCSARTDNLEMGVGTATSVDIGHGAGISVEGAPGAGDVLGAFAMVVDATGGEAAVVGYPTLAAARSRGSGSQLEGVAELVIPYRPD